MALSRVKTWNAAETLTASDLNAEFNNICNHFGSLTNADIDSTASYVMGELVVGTGITSADGGQLHVHTATAGTIQAVADADEAVFENSGASGVTILSGATSTGNIAFGDSGDADNGLIKYTHGSTPTLGVTVAATAVQSIAAAATTLAHDLEIYQDVNNADSAIKIGTSAAEALFVEALNGGSNKTLEELRFTTKTASATANHGKMSFYVDEANIANVNDGGITLESGMVLTGNVTGNASGTAATVTGGTQAAITTCANLVTVGTIGTGVWQGTDVGVAHGGTGLSTVGTSQILTGNGTGALTSESNLTFDGTTLDVVGNAGVGIARTEGTLHVHTATAGSVTAHTGADDLVIENSGSAGLTILTPNDAQITLAFGDVDDNNNGKIQYDHNGDANTMYFSSNGDGYTMAVVPNQKLGIKTASPAHEIDVVGTAGLSTGTAWTNTSDVRIKKDVATITGATDKLKRLRPVSYKYTDQYLSVHNEIDGSKTYHSFIADEYETVFPDAVSAPGDLVQITPATDDAAEIRETLLTNLKQYTPHDLQMFLTAAVQELDARITALES